MLSITLSAQKLPTPPQPGFALPLGSKATIELIPVDSINFDISIIELEYVDKEIDSFGNDSLLFSKKGKDNTIELWFGFATHGDTEEERNENRSIVLKLKNWTDHHLSYGSDISVDENGEEFEETSNIGLYPGIQATEMWPFMIYYLALYDFQIVR